MRDFESVESIGGGDLRVVFPDDVGVDDQPDQAEHEDDERDNQ